MRENTYDLIIVGGGIGGSALAITMSRDGKRCLVLEKSLQFEDRTKGEWMAPWGVLEAKRVGVFDEFAQARGHFIQRHISYEDAVPIDQAEAAVMPLGFVPGVAGPMTQRHPDACQQLFDSAAAAGAELIRGVDDVVVTAGSPPSVSWVDADGAHTASARLVVGADGRNSVVRRQVGLTLNRDPAHHMFSGLLVDDADGWPDDLQTIGTSGDIHFLAFPQGHGRVRLYLGFAIEQRRRVSGPDGREAFLRAFQLDCLPNAEALANATPISPCATYPNEAAWVAAPVVPGVVLIADAAGWDDPITGQGLSVTMRDVRVVSEILKASDDWSVDALGAFVVERIERMRRLRFVSNTQSTLLNEFGPVAQQRRALVRERVAATPALAMGGAALFLGPDQLPAEIFSPRAWTGLFGEMAPPVPASATALSE
jgi:2-polyprenyl-6-methoxyphenol hydroxylase-like FAD-dependent oxidoreductase